MFLYLVLSTSVCSSTLHPDVLDDTLYGCGHSPCVLRACFTQLWWSAFLCMTTAKSLTTPASPSAHAPLPVSPRFKASCHTRPGFLYIPSFERLSTKPIACYSHGGTVLQGCRLSPLALPPLSCMAQLIPVRRKHRGLGSNPQHSFPGPMPSNYFT